MYHVNCSTKKLFDLTCSAALMHVFLLSIGQIKTSDFGYCAKTSLAITYLLLCSSAIQDIKVMSFIAGSTHTKQYHENMLPTEN